MPSSRVTPSIHGLFTEFHFNKQKATVAVCDLGRKLIFPLRMPQSKVYICKKTWKAKVRLGSTALAQKKIKNHLCPLIPALGRLRT